jgi:hypothetical protein
MPYGAHIRPESLDRFVQQIGAQLRHIAPPELLNAGPIELRESFEVWALGLDALGHGTHSGRQIRQLARPVGCWHHQLSFGRRVAAFARSSSSPLTGEHQLEELFISPLAQAIDEGIGWLDQNAKPEEHVRLLTVPACHLHAFWLEDEELKSRLMVIDVTGSAPEELRDTVLGLGLARFRIRDESEFLRGLSSAVAPVGVLLGGTRVLSRA